MVEVAMIEEPAPSVGMAGGEVAPIFLLSGSVHLKLELYQHISPPAKTF